MTDLGITLDLPPPHDPSAGRGERVKRFFADLRPSVATGGRPVLPLLLLFALNAVDEFDRFSFAVLLPEIREWFGVSLQTVLFAVSISGLLAIFVAVPIGFVADRMNRIWMTVLGVFVWGGASVATGFAPGVAFLFGARFAAGIGRTLDPAHSSLLADYYPPHTRGAVFAFHRSANPLGEAIGPLIAGLLASAFFWQLPFIVFSVPAFGLAIAVAVLLREPVRGAQERRALGATEEVALTAEKPPSFTESWHIARNVRTLRRIWIAIPFFVGAAAALIPLFSIYFSEVFDLGPAARGTIESLNAPFSIAGLLVGGVVSNRFLRYRPGRVLVYTGALLCFSAATIALFAVAPILPLAVGLRWVQAFLIAVPTPAAIAIITLVIPPRVRSFAIAVAVLAAAPGLLVGPLLVAPIEAAFGIRAGIAVMAPVFLIGAIILMTSATGVQPDIRQAQAAAMALSTSKRSQADGAAQLLVCRDVDVHYDGVQVLFNVDFDIEEGDIVALLGTNGAGKSTLLRAIAGTSEPSNGAIFFDGDDITYLPANEHASRGIVMVPGGRGVFPTLSVRENLRLAAWMYRDDDAYTKDATAQVLGFFPRLLERLDEQAGNLSGGEQQMLALGQAFLSRPRLLMIDELSLGLAPAIVEQLLGIVRAIHADGTTVILVEQSVNVALTAARKAVFMEKGEIRFSGPTSELLQRTDILRSVFLRGAASSLGSGRSRRADPVAERPVALQVHGVSKRFGGVVALDDVHLDLREGEVCGLIGPNGAGKTTLFDVICGYLAPDRGSVRLFGDDLEGAGPDQRARLGLHRSFQDARLFPALTVEENILVALERHLSTRSTTMAALHLPNVDRAERRLRLRAGRLIELLGLGDFRDKFVRELSTGTRRVVDLAFVVATDPQVLLLDEPSAGVAQRETEELGPLIQRVKFETGASILIIEHDMALISSISDELIALDLGRVVVRGRPADVLEHPDVIESYLGTTQDAIQRSGRTTGDAPKVQRPAKKR